VARPNPAGRCLVLNRAAAMIDLKIFTTPAGLSEVDLVRFCSEFLPKERMYELSTNEARFGLSRMLPTLSSFDPDTVEVLEVGAGSCILSVYLASKRLHVTAVEPLRPEFDFLTDLQNRVLEFCRCKAIKFKLVRTTGERLDLLERFDVVFTINALEHMRDPLLTIDNMYDSLKPGGIALVHCPNYTIPFEVHFNLLLVTRSKLINEWLYRSRISQNLNPKGVWDELNFVRYVDVHRHLLKRRVNFSFDHSVMHELVVRLMDDPIFAERMPAVVRAIGAMLRHSGLLHALSYVPPRFQTPMEVHIRKN
jgi:SAM-dependent methyltransferase